MGETFRPVRLIIETEEELEYMKSLSALSIDDFKAEKGFDEWQKRVVKACELIDMSLAGVV